MTTVMINGIPYVPAPVKSAPVKPAIVDCDGRELSLADRVYVRQSALKRYVGLNHVTREGTLAEAGSGMYGDVLVVDFDDGMRFRFPVNEIRQA